MGSTPELANQLVECPNCKTTIEVPVRSRFIPPAGLPELKLSGAPGTAPNEQREKSIEYKVVPFVALVSHEKGAEGKGAKTAAVQLEQLIQNLSRDGWQYVRLESIETYIEGERGCFGIGATPPSATAYSMAVFRR